MLDEYYDKLDTGRTSDDFTHATAGSFSCKADHSLGRTSSLLDPTLMKTHEANITEQLGTFEWHRI